MSTRTPSLSSLPHAIPVHAEARPGEVVRRISSGQLLPDGARELVIHHHGGEYHLRLTRNDKLILTK